MSRWFAAVGIAVAFAGMASADVAPRFRATINDGWRFSAGSIENAAAVEFDDAKWARVDLPHTWNARDAFDKTRSYRRGIGWYRKSLTVDPALRGRRLFLYFEGANQVADVFVNGRHAGQHVGGYTAFVFEITDLLRFDRPNTLAVRVDNSPDPDIPPLEADFTFYGGIYRNVWLLATSPIHIDVTDHASPGVFVSTPGLTEQRGAVHVAGTIVNQSDRAAALRVVSSVMDPAGAVVATSTVDVKTEAGAASAFTQDTRAVEHPRLWSPASPTLYRVRTAVYEGERLMDTVENPLGFRWFSVDAQKGFALNGQPLRLFGTNRHQDYLGLGNALPDDLQRRDLQLVKETGFNFLRLAHYPQAPCVLDEADRRGLVIWEEIPIVNRIAVDRTSEDAATDPARFAANAEQMLLEMIRQHYNHPSIFFWGTMNEVMLREPKPLPDHYYENLLRLEQRLNQRAHAEDPARKTAIALSRDELANDHGLGDVTDVLGMNLYFGWYYGAFADFGEFLDRIHSRRPSRPLVVTEYGAGSDERVHSLQPVAFDFSSEYAQEYHRASFPQLESRPYLIATAVWNQFDFGSASRQDTKYGINSKGLFFYDRAAKDAALYYQAALRKEPALAIAREWRERGGSALQPVWAFTNQPQVELFVNGASAGMKAPVNRRVEWDVDLAPGPNRMVVRAGSLEDVTTIDYQPSNGTRIAVNAGATYSFVDQAHVIWEADRPYVPGSWGFIDGEPKLSHHRIFGTADDPLDQATREGAPRYQFDVSDGTYQLTLRLVETSDDPKPNVFSIFANGRELVHDVNLAADYGAFTAVSRTFEVVAANGKGIAIDFTPSTGKATVGGIELKRLP